MASRRSEAIEALILALVGGVGVVVGARTFRPVPVVAAPAPAIAEPKGGWPPLPDHAERVASYVLSAKLDPAQHAIDGKGTIELRNVSKSELNDLRLHLYLNAFKNDATLFRRARVGGFRGDRKGAPGFIDVKRLAWDGEDLWPKHQIVSHKGEFPQDPLRPTDPSPVEGAPDDETDVRVPLPRPVAAGASITLEVEFHAVLPEVSERTGYFESFHFAGQWFPKLAKLEPDGAWASFPFHHLAEFYADYGAYDVTLDVPESFVIGASGATVSSKIENGRRIERHVLDDVHDFAWTAWDRFSQRKTRIEGIDVTLLYPRGYDRAADRELVALEHSIRDKNARFGAYPYPVLTVVHPPEGADEAGGMEYPTLITTGGPWWPNHGTHEIEGVTIHEFGHQWFYGLVGTHEVEWPSGDEGFNSFADEMALATMFGPTASIGLGPISLTSNVFGRRGVMGPFDEPIFQPAHRFATGRSYGGRVYGATSAVLLTLRNVYGPQAFDTAMGVWTRRYRFKHPKPDDFFALLAEQVGPECAIAARVALTTPFAYDVFVDNLVSEKAKTPSGWFDLPKGREKREATDAGGYRSFVFVGRRGALDVPVDVELRFADGSRVRRSIRFAEEPAFDPTIVDIPKAPLPPGPPSTPTWYRIDADGPSQLVAAIVDPDRKLLVDRDWLDNFASLGSGRGGAPVTRERAFAWIGVLARMVGP